MPQPTELLNFYPDLETLHVYWDHRRAGRAMPPWANFDAVEMAPWLGRLNVLDVERRGSSTAYRYRIFGTEIAAMLEHEMTGRYVGEGDPGAGSVMLGQYREIVATKTPILCRQDAVKGTRVLPHVRLMLPISEDGRQVSKILVGIHPLWRRSLAALQMPLVRDGKLEPAASIEPLRLVI